MNYIDSSTALSLIKSKAGKVHKALSEKHGFQIYLLEDNSVIGKEHDTFVEFQDVNELETFLSQYQPTRHILQDKNPFNAEFPLHTQNLINGLLDYLNIPSDCRNLDHTLISLANDRFLGKEKDEDLRDKFLLNIIALVGEVIIREKKASWEMILGDDNVTWSPQLNYKGNDIALPVYVFETLFDEPSVIDQPITFSYITIKDIIDISIERFGVRKEGDYSKPTGHDFSSN